MEASALLMQSGKEELAHGPGAGNSFIQRVRERDKQLRYMKLDPIFQAIFHDYGPKANVRLIAAMLTYAISSVPFDLGDSLAYRSAPECHPVARFWFLVYALFAHELPIDDNPDRWFADWDRVLGFPLTLGAMGDIIRKEQTVMQRVVEPPEDEKADPDAALYVRLFKMRADHARRRVKAIEATEMTVEALDQIFWNDFTTHSYPSTRFVRELLGKFNIETFSIPNPRALWNAV